MITRLLESRYSLHTLSLANNQIGDMGGASLVGALVLPEKDLFDSEEYKDPDGSVNATLYGSNQQARATGESDNDDEYLIKNSTLTCLDLSNNSLGKETLEALAAVMKSNIALHTLQLDCCSLSRGGNYLNHIFDECRAFNKSLRCLSLTDSTLSVASFDHLMRIFDGPSPLEQVDLSRCGLTALHLRKSLEKITYSRHLSRLVFSGNKLMDQGVEFLTNVLSNQRPPLSALDLSTCGVTISSAIPFITAVASRETMRSLDLSDNNLHGTVAQMKALCSTLPSASLRSLNLSRCALGVHGSCSLFSALLGNSSLRILLLAENEIKDSVDGPLAEFLEANCSLEVLDLGYNCLTTGALRRSQKALRVESTSSLERKLTELHINLVGNPCGPYELEFPGMARSKNLLRYGHERLDGDEFRVHISGSACDDYWQRKKLLGEIRPERWSEINFIS